MWKGREGIWCIEVLLRKVLFPGILEFRTDRFKSKILNQIRQPLDYDKHAVWKDLCSAAFCVVITAISMSLEVRLC